ncbi:MAG: helix-turn-helix domain-containing protein [Bacilli bacterium]|nr:helix-turn-helix domain-containing protein [Bacilli bacterium]
MKKTFGEIIKYLRLSNNLSQKDVADALNLSVSAISQYETGKRSVSINEINLFADYFRVSSDYLLGREEINTSDLLDKKLKIAYEITFNHKEESTTLTKIMMLLLFISSIIVLFIPSNNYLFPFAIITQAVFIIYVIVKRFFNFNSYKKTFSIPDDVSVYYEYKFSDARFENIEKTYKLFLFILLGLTIVILTMAFFIVPIYENNTLYFMLVLLLIVYAIFIICETFIVPRKIKFYKRLDYFAFGSYLKYSLSLFLSISSYSLLIIFLITFLEENISTPLIIAFGILLAINQLTAYIYHLFMKHILYSYDLMAMVNETLEVKKLS